MRNPVVCSLILLLALLPVSIFAQTVTLVTANERLKEEQVDFSQYIQSIFIDSNVAGRLQWFVEFEVDSINQSVAGDTGLTEVEKAKAIQSLVYFLKQLSENLSLQKFDIYDIPDALESYKLTLRALLRHTPYLELVNKLGPRRSQLLANAFWQYNECTELEDIAVFKRVASLPAYILQFLESRPGFRYADSLLVLVAAHYPSKVVSYLLQHKPGLQLLIRMNKNIYLQQIVSLSENRFISELLPFIIPLAEKRITVTEILDKRKDPKTYFELLVNTLKHELSRPAIASSIFLIPLRNGIKDKSISFYVNQINELHSSAAEIRFAAVNDLRVEDLYYIITSCEEELYTSSYLGLYRRLMEHFNTPAIDSLFVIVKYDNFQPFMRMAAIYNTLGDFLSCMPQKTAAGLLKRFISGIETDANTGLAKAMDIADAFSGFTALPGISLMIQQELKSNYDRCKYDQSFFGMRLYSILQNVFDLVQKKDSVNKFWANLGNHELLERKVLQNKRDEIIEVVLFYGDEDGIGSFNNFIRLYKDPTRWKISKNNYWITIRSLSEQPVIIYANLPLDNETEMDMLAQDSLFAFLKQQMAEPVILIHRGHSYHLSHTLRRLQPTVKLAILGSCGGYNSLLNIANISPDAQIIVSKKIGSQFINDPMIDVINENLQNNRDLVWSEIWEKLRIRFSKNELMLNLFNEYIPPTKNVSLFVLKLFNFYR
ncbi:MAG TPA: hypothetical protein PLG08_04450 [Chitinophagaceae bacterium]|nr:hypothetical protein [Chitinophagaceae bacterium]